MFYPLDIKKIVLLSCESSFTDSSFPVKAGVIVLWLRFDCPVEILAKGFGLQEILVKGFGYRFRVTGYGLKVT